MPEKIKKVNGYQVSTPGGVKAKNTTKEKAEAQARLLRGVEHGWEPAGQSAGKKASKKPTTKPARKTSAPSRPSRRKR